MVGGQGVVGRDGTSRSAFSEDSEVVSLVAVHLKHNLHTVFLAYLLERPRTGRELMDEVFREAQVHLSPGRVYPLLRSLEKRGLLVAEEGARQVVYRPANRATVEAIVRQEMEACSKMMEHCRSLVRARL